MACKKYYDQKTAKSYGLANLQAVICYICLQQKVGSYKFHLRKFAVIKMAAPTF